MCQKCYTKKVNLEAKLANLVAEIINHNKTVSPRHLINAVVIVEENGGDITLMTTMPKIETMVVMSLVTNKAGGNDHG